MLDYTPLIDESKGEKHDISGDIEFRNVTFQYPTSSTISLNNISFKIDQGEYIAFVG
jgi:ABC-type multidrug transport system fused ATPase/permease subunit